MNASTDQFSRVLEKYSLSRPISPEDQRYIIKSRKAGLARLLRSKGAYGALFVTLIIIKLFFKKFGISLSLIQAKIVAGMVAVAVSAGSVTGVYTAARHVTLKIDGATRPAGVPASVEPARVPGAVDTSVPALTTDSAIRSFYKKLEQVDLDDGTRLVGAVIYQDARTVRIHTAHGIINVPVASVRSIRLK